VDNKIVLNGAYELNADEGSFNSLLMLDGSVDVFCDIGSFELKKGESGFIPAGEGKYSIKGRIGDVKSCLNSVYQEKRKIARELTAVASTGKMKKRWEAAQ